ncbi:MAG: ROK family protein [Candidatus Aminicenantes bacterium]|nr:ROK family protein [Candidatus Aminicenantes bacterium]MDH5386234.1 ROK family protein [Candidatus Aminicenantes bacterium]
MQLFAGFDLGGTHLKYGLVDESGRILFESQVDTPETTEKLLHTLKDIWNTLKNKHQSQIASAGLGFPGIFSQQEQKIIQSPNYPDIDNFALIPAISEFIDIPFWVNNDANMAAFGEYKCGAGQNTHSLILLTIGTGVGSGIIMEGKIWQGACGYAGEMGHVAVNPEGEPCKCGSRGCLETEVSAPKIVKNYLTFSKLKENITSEEVSQRAKNKDVNASKAFALTGRYLGIGLSIVINLLNPEKILLGGGVMEAGNFLLQPAIEEASKRSFKGSFECCSIERAILGNKAGFVGAALWSKQCLHFDP